MDPDDWRKTPVYMMDFEGSPVSGVVEYGVVTLLEGRIAATCTALCRPTGYISQRDREVHGIGDKETRGEPLFSDCYDRFVQFRRKGVFAAHNRHAENGFLKSTWAIPPEVPDWRGHSTRAQEWGPWIDTLSIYRSLYPGLAGYGLTELVDLFECREAVEERAKTDCPAGRRKPHCALYDALASSLLLLRLEQTEELQGRITIGWLLELSSQRNSQQELF